MVKTIFTTPSLSESNCGKKNAVSLRFFRAETWLESGLDWAGGAFSTGIGELRDAACPITVAAGSASFAAFALDSTVNASSRTTSFSEGSKRTRSEENARYRQFELRREG